jgi:hypothetical protein
MANRKSKRNQKRRTQKKRNRKTKMRGGSDFSVPIRVFYPQNSFEHDPSRQMTTSVLKGGSKRNHSRRYLKGGSGFFPDFGVTTGAQSVSNQITGSYPSNFGQSLGPTYKV